MSVNQVGVAPQQQVQGGGFSLAPAIGLGAVGGTVGYFAGGKRPNLEKVFAMPADSFETITKDLTGEAKEAADIIGNEINSIEANARRYRGRNSKVYMDFERHVLFQRLADDAKEVVDYKAAKKAYEDKLAAKITEGLDDTAAREALKDSDELAKLLNAKDALRAAKEKALRASNDDVSKNIVKAFDEAEKVISEAKTNKIAELVKNQDMNSAFSKFKSIFPKEGKIKAAGIWGGIAAGAGLLLALLSSGSKKTQA